MPFPVTSPIPPQVRAAAPADGAGFWARSRYRIWQFIRGWRAEVSTADRAEAACILAPPAQALFAHMPVDAQAHSLRVLHALQTEDPDLPNDVAAAALLHDVGKTAALEQGAYLGLWLRGPIVLVEAVCPAWLQRWASPKPGPTLRYAIYVQLEHARIGAEQAAAAGCSPLTCWLIAQHQTASEPGGPTGTPAETELARLYLARLQAADGKH